MVKTQGQQMQRLASMIARREGKKSQARIGDIREILGILSDVLFSKPEVFALLYLNGMRRAKRKVRK